MSTRLRMRMKTMSEAGTLIDETRQRALALREVR